MFSVESAQVPAAEQSFVVFFVKLERTTRLSGGRQADGVTGSGFTPPNRETRAALVLLCAMVVKWEL